MQGSRPSRREIPVVCPACDARSLIPASSVSRNSYFCSNCGKPIDLTQALRLPPPSVDGAPPMPRRDRGNSRYKSARKGRR